jgi:hypothetical protein
MQIALPNHDRPISVQVHSVLDYVYGMLLVIAPWMFGFSGEASAQTMAVGFGVASMLWSAFTAYPASLVPFLPFRVHLWLDVLSGIMLIVAPILMPISPTAQTVLISFGCIAMIVAALTRRPHPHMPS